MIINIGLISGENITIIIDGGELRRSPITGALKRISNTYYPGRQHGLSALIFQYRWEIIIDGGKLRRLPIPGALERISNPYYCAGQRPVLRPGRDLSVLILPSIVQPIIHTGKGDIYRNKGGQSQRIILIKIW